MRDPETMTDDEKLATVFGVGGAGALPWKLGMEYTPTFRPYPSALIAWYLAFTSLILFPAALIAVPLAVRAAIRGNRWAWLAAIWAVAAAAASVRVMTSITAG